MNLPTLIIALLLNLSPPTPSVPNQASTQEIDSKTQLQVDACEGWVEAFGGGLDAMAAYRKQHFATPDQAGWQELYDRMREGLGELETYEIRIPESGVVELRAEALDSGRFQFTFRFDAQDKITEFNIGEITTNDLPELEIGDAEPAEAIDAYIRALEKQDAFSGVVLIATDGEIWFEQAYGLASREFGVPNTLETRFDVGSFNKDYTQLALLQLVQDGALELSDTVGKHLPDYPNKRVREEVTLRQLMEHRSGLGDYFDSDYLATPMQQLRNIDDYIPIWGPKPLAYEPGAREEYSNYGYTVLGAVLEQVTGMSYPDYVAARIFEPAGMDSTGFFEVDGIEPNVAVGYTFKDGTGRRRDRLHKNIFMEPIKGGPWGKSYSTARDLFRFFDALYGHQLLAPELSWFGDGWQGSAALAGGGPGLSAVLLVDAGLALILLSNHDEPGAEDLGVRLQEALR